MWWLIRSAEEEVRSRVRILHLPKWFWSAARSSCNTVYKSPEYREGHLRQLKYFVLSWHPVVLCEYGVKRVLLFIRGEHFKLYKKKVKHFLRKSSHSSRVTLSHCPEESSHAVDSSSRNFSHCPEESFRTVQKTPEGKFSFSPEESFHTVQKTVLSQF